MVRTKKVAKKPVVIKKEKDDDYTVDVVIKQKIEEKEKLIVKLQDELELRKEAIMEYMHGKRTRLMKYLNLTIGELKTLDLTQGSTIYKTLRDITSTNNVPVTSTVTKPAPPRRTSRRNKASGDDEGYLTAGSRASSETRQTNRSRKLQTMTVKKGARRSRSATVRQADSFVTPLNKQALPPSHGYITPKVKMNTPQAILRQPQIGEVAYSAQGSPLLTSCATQMQKTNVNIPLGNGQVFTVHPHADLRPSLMPRLDDDAFNQVFTVHPHADLRPLLIPRLDDDAFNQVKVLHENLTKLMKFTK